MVTATGAATNSGHDHMNWNSNDVGKDGSRGDGHRNRDGHDGDFDAGKGGECKSGKTASTAPTLTGTAKATTVL